MATDLKVREVKMDILRDDVLSGSGTGSVFHVTSNDLENPRHHQRSRAHVEILGRNESQEILQRHGSPQNERPIEVSSQRSARCFELGGLGQSG